MSVIRVLVVDDSAFARKVLSNVLGADPRLQVVGTARDGLDALDKVATLAPDVITLDLVMPHLDGMGVLQALGGRNRPATVIVSMSDADSELGVRALQAGAIDLVHKPTALATDRMYELGDELVQKVVLAAGAHPRPPAPELARPQELAVAEPLLAVETDVVVLGTSTGGPQALTELLPAFPVDLPVPIVIALHIPASYTEALALRLDRASRIRVVEARDGLELGPGMAIVAPGGQHLRLERCGSGVVTRISPEPLTSLYRPSVDILFRSAAEAFGTRVLGVVLTGMGDDGLEGARAIAARGGRLLTEAADSCVVYGMPRCVLEAGLSYNDVPLSRMAAAICRAL